MVLRGISVGIIAIAGLSVLGTANISALAEEPEPSRTALDCPLGPVEKGFGRSDWLVYGCMDGASLLIEARRDNPAYPSYFTFTKYEGGYSLAGEGMGKKKVARAGFEDMKFLQARDIQTLYNETAAAAAAQ
ncbi:MAG: hypothetical protein ACE363_04815 [Alphaproteobacteria bacterium]